MQGAHRAISYFITAGRTALDPRCNVSDWTTVMNFQHGCYLVSHDLIDSCKVFGAGPMGKPGHGLWWKWRGGVRGVKAARSASCRRVHKLFAACFPERS